MKFWLRPLGLLLVATATAAADDDVRSKPLTLHPPAAADRALRYALLPELQDMTPGNAAEHYRQAIKDITREGQQRTELEAALDRLSAAPPKDVPREEVARLLKQYEKTLAEMDAGARCENCDWGLIEEMRKKGVGYLGPDYVSVRVLGKLLDLRARCELADGKTAQAARTLRSGFAMSRQVGEAPGLLAAFYGLQITDRMTDRLEELIQRPDAPSFYWPLADLPRPFIDLRKPAQGERVLAYNSFPGLTEMAGDPNARPWTPEQVETVVGVMWYIHADIDIDILRAANQGEMLLRIAAQHEDDKARLLAEGRPKELVDAMPHIQVALLASMRRHDQFLDEMTKWQSVPYWEARPAIEQFVRERIKERGRNDGSSIPVTYWLGKGAKVVFAYRARADRRIAALRCVEAVRLYAAGHDGKLPASLDDLKDTPVPDDPATGKPFGYRVVGDRAFFSSTPFPGQPATNVTTPTYELCFKP
jgi:hypothetical protein